MRERRGVFEHIDWWLVIIFLLLVIMGWLNIYAAVYDENHGSIVDMHCEYGNSWPGSWPHYPWIDRPSGRWEIFLPSLLT